MCLMPSFSELFQCVQDAFHDEEKERLPDLTKYSAKKSTRNGLLGLNRRFLKDLDIKY